MFSPNFLTKRQQRAVLCLVVVILNLQGVAFWSSKITPTPFSELPEGTSFQQEYTLLKHQLEEDTASNFFPFNPNFISAHKAYRLGLSSEEFDRLKAHREQNLWINSGVEFQQITKISDHHLNSIQPYFKFPQWVLDARQNKSKPEKKPSKIDLNKATALELPNIRGIGPVLSQRIFQQREQYDGGFADWVELTTVYGLSDIVLERLKDKALIKNPRTIRRINLNAATQEDLVHIPFIDYEMAYAIIEMRTLKENYKSLNELTKLKDFPSERLDLIKLYLYINIVE